MKVILYGTDAIVKRIETALEGRGAEIYVAPHPPGTGISSDVVDEATLAVVDTLAERAEEAYRYFKQTCDLPVVLVINERRGELTRLDTLEADGYIRRSAGLAEIIARLEAVRRLNRKAVSEK